MWGNSTFWCGSEQTDNQPKLLNSYSWKNVSASILFPQSLLFFIFETNWQNEELVVSWEIERRVKWNEIYTTSCLCVCFFLRGWSYLIKTLYIYISSHVCLEARVNWLRLHYLYTFTFSPHVKSKVKDSNQCMHECFKSATQKWIIFLGGKAFDFLTSKKLFQL